MQKCGQYIFSKQKESNVINDITMQFSHIDFSMYLYPTVGTVSARLQMVYTRIQGFRIIELRKIDLILAIKSIPHSSVSKMKVMITF